MKIKVALLDSDENYLKRILNAFEEFYSDKLEVYAFTSGKSALEAVADENIDVFLVDADGGAEINNNHLKCAMAYLVEGNEISSYAGQKVVSKFQKFSDLYRDILKLYLEVTHNNFDYANDGRAKTIVFCSPAGGAGATTVAIALARKLAGQDMRVLYLNMEIFNSSDRIFGISEHTDFDKVLYAVKSRKNNLKLIIEGQVKTDSYKVQYFETYDMMNLSMEHIKFLFDNLSPLYDYIIVDLDNSFCERNMAILSDAYKVVLVSDSKEASVIKMSKCLTVISKHDKKNEKKIGFKVMRLYNKANTAVFAAHASEGEICVPRVDVSRGSDAVINMICTEKALNTIN